MCGCADRDANELGRRGASEMRIETATGLAGGERGARGAQSAAGGVPGEASLAVVAKRRGRGDPTRVFLRSGARGARDLCEPDRRCAALQSMVM